METQYSEPQKGQRTIGSLLVDAGKLSSMDVDRIVCEQKEFNLRFGDAAVKLGLISEEDIQRVVSKQFDYDCLMPDNDSVSQSIVTAFQTHGKVLEQFRNLRSQLSLRWFEDNKSLVVTAAREGQGASYVAANLAVMFSQLGGKTLIIDADMRSPSQGSNFKISEKLGLSDILAKRVGLDIIESIDGIENLSILKAGTIPPNSLELIGHGRFATLMLELETIFDVVIIDSPPALEFSDTQALCAVVKGAVLVANKNVTSLGDLESVKEQIEIAGARPLGVVLNNA